MELRKRKRDVVGEAGSGSFAAPSSGENSETSDRAVVLRGQSFRSAADLIAYLRAIENTDERYDAQAEVLEKMMLYHSAVDNMIEDVFGYVEGDRAFTAAMSDEEFNRSWGEVRVIVEQNKERRNRELEARTKAAGKWGTEVVDWLAGPGASGYLVQSLRTLAMQYSVEEGAGRVNRAVLSRLSERRKGVSTRRAVQPADFSRAAKFTTWAPVTTQELQAFGYRIGRYGFLEEGTPREVEDGSDSSVPDFPSPAREMGPDQSRSSATPEGALISDDDFRAETRDDMIDEELMDGVGAELERLERLDPGESEDASGDESRSEGGGTRESRCGCSSDVTQGWKRAVVRGRSYEPGTNLKLLKSMVGFRKVCYPHSKAMGGHIGLRIKQLNAQQLQQRLEFIHENRLDIGKLKTNRDTFSWFRVKNRPPRASDALGPYKFKHGDLPSDFNCNLGAVLDWIGGVDVPAWERDGSINIPIFTWWFETEIGGIVHAEFDAYRHHLREINGKSNYGWLRNMFYSIGQQLMRQDPVYYAAYAALRPDRQWRLVSYPYYAKYAVRGDNTYFRHLDLNIPELLANDRGCNMIQGSVSLDEEDETTCTVILPGMQHKLREWWDRVVERGQETDGFVHRITEQMFTRDDAKALGVDWQRVPCRRGEARITLPHLPHGADGPSTATRRTMLPWLVGLQDDLTSLEVVEAGTWEMLSSAHRDMVSPAATPSGLANRYGAIPYKFPAAVEVAGLGALSDALVCRRRWDSALVLRDRDILLSGSREQAAKYIKEWRERAVATAKDAFALFVQLERQAFGDKSYFYHLDRLQRLGIPFPEVEPDEEGSEGEDGKGAEGGEGAGGYADFAEAGVHSGAASE